ncbi:hypothetical protein CRG98_035809 [Punica granatum]|uniref:Zinc finger PMZ-type domain-containing protein n=1 Tax=Punica granatum TaxID=22663 RepID=A0A2I0IIH3_PUNGR|nr:hypothetical protein CRG98_035809 [Punica granatum]
MGYKGQLLEHKHCQLYVKHKTNPNPNPNPKAFQQHKATKAATEEGDKATEGGALGRKGVDDVVDRAAEESEDNNSGSESDFAFGDVPGDVSEKDDPELQDIISQVQIAKAKRAEKLKSLSLQKDGLVQAVAKLLLHVEHRMCARHIHANWGGSDKGPKIQRQFWNIAKSTTEADFKENMELLHKMSPQAYEDLLERPNPRAWQLSGIPCCHAVCALLHKGLDPGDCVHSFYKNEMFLEAYGKVMEPAVCGSADPIPTVQDSSRPGSVGELIVAREADESRQTVTANQLQAQAQRRSKQKKSEGSTKIGLQSSQGSSTRKRG